MDEQIGNNQKKYHITRNFVASVLLISALLVVIPLITVYLLTQAYDDQIRNETSQVSASIRQTVRSFVDGAYNLCYELAENPSILSMDGEIQSQILAGCAERNNYIELLYVTGMDGMQTARSSGECGDRSERWWFIKMMETELPFVSQSYTSVSTGMPCTAVFLPMYGNGDSEMTAVFGADLSLEYIQRLVEQFASPENGRYSYIIDGDGVVLAHPDSLYVEEELTIYDEYKAVIDSVMSGSGGLEIIEENGAAYYLSYEPITLPGYSDSWSVITLQDRAVAMEVVTQLVMRLLLVIVLIFIVFIVLLTWFFKSLRRTFNFLENARYESEQANKSKTNFLATMSHEIRTPMNAIIGITQIQLQKENLQEEYAEVFEMIYSSGNSLLGIINDILDMSKIETGKLDINPVEYDTPNFINDTVQLNILRIGDKKIDFKLKVDENLPSKLYGDELRVKQVLNNLLSNAIKYTEKGFVKLSVGHSASDDGYITMSFCVEDTGQGLTAENKELLFVEYSRFNLEANRTTEGAGLGMTITKKLVEMMDGTISLESEYGKGSAFTVTIRQKQVECSPIGPEIVERLHNFTYVDESHIYQSHIVYEPMPYGSVLVVDDVETNLYVAEGILSLYELHVELAESGYEAIEKVESGKEYDIIFMDHMMPNMDGIVATQKLRELGYKGTIVALTANALVGNEEMFTQNGFDGFVPKPIDLRSIDVILNKFIRDRYNDKKILT